MSRSDVQDFEYPPGLTSSRPNRGDHEHESGHFHSPSGSLSTYNTRPFNVNSYGQSNPLSAQASLPRSLGIQEREMGGYGSGDGWNNTNRNPSAVTPAQQPQQFNQPFHQQLPSSQSLPSLVGPAGHPSLDNNPNTAGNRSSAYLPGSIKERDTFVSRGSQPTSNQPPAAYAPLPTNPLSPSSQSSRSTLWWGELEPWMDEEYAKQVCGLMNWDPQANNPGYCFLTFPTPSHAANVLAHINGGGGNAPATMPNSTKPFVLNWASSTPIPPSLSPPGMPVQQNQYPKEYSIFVGDLAPEASNSDLVAVFRNPVLGLRNDREPKFIRPFLSCKSAKIMLDPVTGVSRGYGFVRFTDEADQQRALIEMHGLYCLSRPMRISPATAKYKPPPSLDLPQVQMPPSMGPTGVVDEKYQPMTIAMPLPGQGQPKSVSSPIAGPQGPNAATNSFSSSNISTSGSGSSMSAPSMSSGPSTSVSGSTLASNPSDDLSRLPQDIIAQLAQYASGNVKPSAAPVNSITAPFASQGQDQGGSPRYNATEESWKHQAQARAILGNLIGPNGEQLTSTDPYNTTVFVGGLSPLISEETLRTFFAPFGDIHYVKVPVGKHCGFVQFVRKADAERAIEKMQGFPIGGSRIRLSWGRSQYKAAQAAAQAAQAAALQAHLQSQSSTKSQPLTNEQAMQLLQQFGLTSFLPFTGVGSGDAQDPQLTNEMRQANEEHVRNMLLASSREGSSQLDQFKAYGGAANANSNQGAARPNMASSFSPFSPEVNTYSEENRGRSDMMSNLSKPFMPGFGPVGQTQGGDGKTPPITPTAANAARPAGNAQRYGSFLENSSSSYAGARTTNSGVISRPPSSSNRKTTPPIREHVDYFEGHDQDSIQDLNGTLASLDLNEAHSWKLPEHGKDNVGA
ncbi:hypothetical protein EVG20_g6550 [Dentipellis fragilis]|uniref:RRM domain-containing protein n=1 Tax=Dentipellis fragilis TaxID=205917 RepID=A0A4Y9YM24_9AGAM|nr:hypothetical protein EVG20_g6550 [Dentipellis fragilis]